ncbi:uncharacterized protein [Nicotiana tomentosiformis]|uniref:uncharacterized protein n=1 Tax=Nicotiana tomentosiformis TaxID=4098 RepID=UPI00388CD5A4
MSVIDYEARFSELSRHALMILLTDAETVQRFITSLHYGMQVTMAREIEMWTPYEQGVSRKSLGDPVYVSTPVGNSIIVDQIYWSCIMIFYGYETRADLLLLDMTDFEVFLGMDWLSLCHAVLDFHAKTITLVMPELPRLEWRGSSISTSSRVISFVKARHMVEKGCFAYLAYVQDTTVETPTIDSVPVV